MDQRTLILKAAEAAGKEEIDNINNNYYQLKKEI